MANVIVPPEEITKQVNEVIAKYVDTSAINLNKLIDGSSVNRPNASNATAIQHLVRRINGSGYSLKHNLTLVRKTDDDEIFREAAAGAGKVSLDKISWFMRHVFPADAAMFSIYKTIESKVKIPVVYRTRQCDVISS